MNFKNLIQLIASAGIVSAQSFCNGASHSGTSIKETSNKVGTINGIGYELWADGGNNSATFYSDGSFSCSFQNSKDYLCRTGLSFDSTKTYGQIGEMFADFKLVKQNIQNVDYSYVGIYGWTRSPLVEFYIVDNWLSQYRPGDWVGNKKHGDFNIDGAMYTVFENDRFGPSIDGDTQFKQYFSIRQQPRDCGTININAHFQQWEKLGMRMGKMHEAKILGEAGSNGGGTSGTADFPYAKVYIGQGGGGGGAGAGNAVGQTFDMGGFGGGQPAGGFDMGGFGGGQGGGFDFGGFGGQGGGFDMGGFGGGQGGGFDFGGFGGQGGGFDMGGFGGGQGGGFDFGGFGGQGGGFDMGGFGGGQGGGFDMGGFGGQGGGFDMGGFGGQGGGFDMGGFGGQGGGFDMGGFGGAQAGGSCPASILSQGYRCCNAGCQVVYTDNDGNWGVENGQWCGCGNPKTGDGTCAARILSQGYRCCKAGCIVYYTDADGDWGVENDQWCGCGGGNQGGFVQQQPQQQPWGQQQQPQQQPWGQQQQPQQQPTQQLGGGGGNTNFCSASSHSGTSIKETSNKVGTINGIGYELWADGGNNSATFYSDGSFSCSFQNSKDYLCRTGLSFDSTQTYSQIGHMYADFKLVKQNIQNVDYSYVGIYGWTRSPLVEFYIVDNWLSQYRPGDWVGNKKHGDFQIDGATYTVFENDRFGPSIDGDTQFKQYFSIRQQPRDCGTIDINAHFQQWEKLGMRMGKMHEAKILGEAGSNGGGTSGTADFPYAKVYTK